MKKNYLVFTIMDNLIEHLLSFTNRTKALYYFRQSITDVDQTVSKKELVNACKEGIYINGEEVTVNLVTVSNNR